MKTEPLNKFQKWLYRVYNEKVEFGIQEEMDTIEMVINKFETIFEKEL